MIPKKVNICGIPFEVVVCKDHFNSDVHLGMIDYEKGQIKINGSFPELQQLQVLRHEMVHGFLTMNSYYEETNNEHLVDALALAIGQAFDLKQQD